MYRYVYVLFNFIHTIMYACTFMYTLLCNIVTCMMYVCIHTYIHTSHNYAFLCKNIIIIYMIHTCTLSHHFIYIQRVYFPGMYILYNLHINKFDFLLEYSLVIPFQLFTWFLLIIVDRGWSFVNFIVLS
jgi:hypothetical protein